MRITTADSFNEKCDKVLIYLKGVSERNIEVQELIKINDLELATGINGNDPAINFLWKKKDFISIHIKEGYVQISSAGMAFISHTSFVQEQINIDNEGQLKWYDKENAKKMFEDYPSTKRNANIALFIAIVAVLATLVQVWLQWKGK